MSHNPFKTILEFIAKDQVEPAILAQNDYLRLENKILKEQLSSGNKKLNGHQRKTLAELGHKIREINRQIFEESIQIVKPETLLRWHRKFVARKFDGSKNRDPNAPKQKRITKEIELQIVQMAQDNERAGYKTIQGFLMDIGIKASVTTIKNILKKHGIEPAPDREKHLPWDKFIKAHKEMLWGCDFFTQEVWTMKGLATYYVLVFIHLGSRKLEIVGMTENPTMEWTTQQARNFVYDKDEVPEKAKMKVLIHDGGTQFDHKWNKNFLTIFKSEGVKLCKVNHPQLNSFSERVIQSIQNQCTNRLIFIGEKSLRFALKQYQMFYNTERHHQGIGNVIPFPSSEKAILTQGKVKKNERLGGLLCQYYREVA